MIRFGRFVVLLCGVLASCAEQQESTDLEKALDRLEQENVSQSDVDALMDELADQEGTYEVRVPKAKFKVKFPVMHVKESTTTQLINDTAVEIFHYTANMQGKDHSNLAYQLDYVFLPEVKTPEEINALFNEQRAYVLSATNGTLEFEKVITLEGVPGRHLYFTVDASHIKVNYKMYFKNGIFYTLEVITKEGKLFNTAIAQFFDAFEITT
jgi:hypothetical protein